MEGERVGIAQLPVTLNGGEGWDSTNTCDSGGRED